MVGPSLAATHMPDICSSAQQETHEALERLGSAIQVTAAWEHLVARGPDPVSQPPNLLRAHQLSETRLLRFYIHFVDSEPTLALHPLLRCQDQARTGLFIQFPWGLRFAGLNAVS